MRGMGDPYVAGAVIVGVVNALAGLAGGLLYATGRTHRSFWWLVRAGQGVAALYAVFCGLYAAIERPPQEGLTWVYILTPIAVSWFAEQLRLVAAQVVIERHGFDEIADLRAEVAGGDATIDPERARLVTGIAHAVVLREIAVMATAAVVISFLAWRAVIGA